jgi:hypothetical protein
LPQSGELEQLVLRNLQANWQELKILIAYARVENMREHYFECGKKLGEIVQILTKEA